MRGISFGYGSGFQRGKERDGGRREILIWRRLGLI